MSFKQQPQQQLGLLLSDAAKRCFGMRIAEILGNTPYCFIHPNEEPDANGCFPVHIAFISRDVTGTSTKKELTETLQGFYKILRASPQLTWVHGHAAGADRPIFTELYRRGVTVTTSSGANAEAVAQMALTGILALARRLPQLIEAQSRRVWAPLLGGHEPRDLSAQTALIVGFGAVGQELARLLKALRMKVIAVRREATPTPLVDRVVTYDALPEVLPHVDWLILSCALTKHTRCLIDAHALSLLPPGAKVVNVARGEVIVQEALIAALSSGRLGGAFLDVFVEEPLPPASPLWSLANVLVTPHTAGHTAGHYQRVGGIFLDNLQRWRDKQMLRNAIDLS